MLGVHSSQGNTSVEIQHLSPKLDKGQDKVTKNYKTLWGYFDQEIKWANTIFLTVLHLWTVYGVLTLPGWREFFISLIFGYIYGGFCGFGVTAGAHRLYTHKCYKATLPLRILLIIAYAGSSQNKLYDWVRDHRVHHKFSETDADPHNSRRGFFFAHCGWLMLKKHPEVLRKGKTVDCSDLLEDPVVRFQQKYFLPLILIFGHVIPIACLMYMANYSFIVAFHSNLWRWVGLLNATWAVNSAAHLWGSRPYDKNIFPVETTFVSFIALGEGWHNYHHTFPWDYKASEYSVYFNITTVWLDFFAKIGWAYDMKQPSKELVESTVQKTGDGSHFKWGHDVIEETEGVEISFKKFS